MLKDFCVIWLCLLIVFLPGCSALAPWLAGEGADTTMMKRDLDDMKAWIDKADANQDGKLTLNEGLVGVAGAVVTSILGTNYVRNRARRQRGEPVDPVSPVS